MAEQLHLSLATHQAANFDHFCWQGNASLKTALTHFASSSDQQLLIKGSRYAGGRLLLQALCQQWPNQRVAYLPLDKLIAQPVSVLDGIEHHEVFALDSLHVLQQSAAWQERVFSLFNQVMLRPATRWVGHIVEEPEQPATTGLADLDSRLGLGVQLSINEPLSPQEAKASLDWYQQIFGISLSEAFKEKLLLQLPRRYSAYRRFFLSISEHGPMHNQREMLDLLNQMSQEASKE